MEKSSGNVFADLGLPHPEHELLKAKLTLQIYRLIKQRGVTQAEAGKILGIKQPHVSALMRNPLRRLLRGTPHGLSNRPGSRHRNHRPAHAQATWRSVRGRMSGPRHARGKLPLPEGAKTTVKR
jgi:predicted XRE-type DNA-binding protein